MLWAYSPVGMFHIPEKFAEIENLNLNYERFFLVPARETCSKIEEKLKLIEEQLSHFYQTSSNQLKKLLPRIKTWRKQLVGLKEQIEDYRTLGNTPFEELTGLDRKVNLFQHKVSLLEKTVEYKKNTIETDFLVGIKNSISKVYCNKPFDGQVTNKAIIQMARNEYEGFQVVILPLVENIKNLELIASTLTGPNKAKIKSANIEIQSVQEVIIDNTTSENRWPEVLNNPGPINLSGDYAQSFFVTVYADKNLPAGDYHGTLTARAEGCQPVSIDLTVAVWDFALPKETHCHTGLFNINDYSICSHFGVKLFSQEHERVMVRIFEYFARHRIQPGDATPVSFLSQYFITWGRPGPEYYWDYYAAGAKMIDPAYEVKGLYSPEMLSYWEKWARWWRERGLPVGEIGLCLGWPESIEKDPDFVREYLTAYWNIIDKNGWQKYTFIRYPDEIDELGKNGPEVVKNSGTFVKKYAPGIPRQSVQTGDTPQEPYLDYVDLWFTYASTWKKAGELCARLIREDKSKVFWLGLHNHIRVDVPDVAPRILFTILRKYGMSGSGLWTSTWEFGKPKLVDGEFHVESNNLDKAKSILIWPAKNGVLFSRRLELIRDGIEDYDYHWLLEHLISTAEKRYSKTPALVRALKTAKAAFNIDDKLVTDITQYSTKPEELLAYRSRMAEAIVALSKALR